VTRCHFALRRFALTIVVALLTLSASDVSGLISISPARIDLGARRHRKPGGVGDEVATPYQETGVRRGGSAARYPGAERVMDHAGVSLPWMRA
jgi:hypothetical protein